MAGVGTEGSTESARCSGASSIDGASSASGLPGTASAGLLPAPSGTALGTFAVSTGCSAALVPSGSLAPALVELLAAAAVPTVDCQASSTDCCGGAGGAAVDVLESGSARSRAATACRPAGGRRERAQDLPRYTERHAELAEGFGSVQRGMAIALRTSRASVSKPQQRRYQSGDSFGVSQHSR